MTSMRSGSGKMGVQDDMGSGELLCGIQEIYENKIPFASTILNSGDSLRYVWIVALTK